ncbi:TauD/TfdA family dioxygenase [Dactylosporangium sp. NPDC051541]|uniref:TauD/TfdA family dioxygenase n=1 Tax=Dactylosporangium sp. NPDC051541 TaxID=3363977 RepID=UPI0037B6AF88
MIKGIFRQAADQPHVPLRRRLLDAAQPLPAPPFGRDVRADDSSGLATIAREQLSAHGAAVVRLDRPLDAEEFLAFGATLGTAQPELAPAVQPFVESEVILNLVTTSPATIDTDLQPFAANWLSLHTESSGAPVPVQPRYIVLMCVTPGDDPRCARTVLLPMREVYGRLSERDREVLRSLRYEQGDPPPILRIADGRPVFSVRDFQEDPLNWVHDGPLDAPDEVNAVLARMYAAMYGSPGFGVRWDRGLLVVIDNAVHFHGRTAGVAAPPGSTRHLKRLRIGANRPQPVLTGSQPHPATVR